MNIEKKLEVNNKEKNVLFYWNLECYILKEKGFCK